MAKDPAFLFYPADFLVGVMDMTDEEVGVYIRLLCRQHQKGHLSEGVIKRAPETVQEKFVKDSNNKYYNERLEKEINKRKKYTAQRLKNLMGNHMESHMEDHMEDHMDNHMERHMESHMGNHTDIHKSDHMESHMDSHTINENRNKNKNVNSDEIKRRSAEVLAEMGVDSEGRPL